MFRELEARTDNPLDNGMVEGEVSIADKAQVERVEGKKESEKKD